MEPVNRELMEGLLKINCKYNYRVEDDGKCYSSICMMNQNKVIEYEIKENGCICYKHLLEDK